MEFLLDVEVFIGDGLFFGIAGEIVVENHFIAFEDVLFLHCAEVEVLFHLLIVWCDEFSFFDVFN